MEKLKENVELSGSRSSGVAPCQEQMNREEANGSSPLQMTAVDKLEDCLLYTSPSPRDMRRSRMPSSA